MHLWYQTADDGFKSDYVGTVTYEDDYGVFKKGWTVDVNLYMGGMMARGCMTRLLTGFPRSVLCGYFWTW